MTLDIRSHCEKGAANKTLDKKKFGQIIIPLPPIELQRAIAAALYAADAEAASLYKRAADTRADARAAADAALAFGLSAGTGGSDDDTGADDDAADAAAAADVDC
jgi:hypothetical protein